MVQDCPNSYENIERVHESTAEDIEDCWLFTGSKTELMQDLVGESLNSAVLDSVCNSTVAGEEWLKCCFDTLRPESLAQVTQKKSYTVFKFRGGSQLKSMKKVQFPCKIAGQKCFITTDIVKSDILSLLSKSAMKEAKMKLDLENDSAMIFGKYIELQCTSSEHSRNT